MLSKIKKIRVKLAHYRKQQIINKYRSMGVNIGHNCDFVSIPDFSSEPYLISIGDNTTISFNCTFITHDAATRVIRKMNGYNPQTVIYGPISIGKNCFVGANCTILPGVKIGDNCVIGACSVVNRDIPSNSVAAGVPCKVKCTIEEYISKHESDFLYIVDLPYFEKKKYLLNHFHLNNSQDEIK